MDFDSFAMVVVSPTLEYVHTLPPWNNDICTELVVPPAEHGVLFNIGWRLHGYLRPVASPLVLPTSCINWAGGLHQPRNARRLVSASVNDIVLGILELLRVYPRVLYVDIDCHRGDGVEEAFYTTDHVMTCSFHKYGEYFPGTGTQEDKGRGKGKGYAVNVPLKDGITDESFQSIFEPVVDKILEVFQPNAVVLQCGADSLSGDKLGCLNLTMHGHAHCVQYLRKKNVPLILLGRGGYTVKNVARTRTYETACALGIEDTIDPNLPWSEYFEWFSPRYRLEVVASNMEDMNIKDGSLEQVRINALEHLRELNSAPSVGMHDVPNESLLEHLGFGKESDTQDKLDQRLAQHSQFRVVYKLQESDTSSDDESWDSDESVGRRHPRRRRKQRMSLLTGQYFDVAHNRQSWRKFFQSRVVFDDTWQRVKLAQELGLGFGVSHLAGLMERGGGGCGWGG
ncbi:hypothetical protein IW261DRAFT_1594481 [Armillaria novae-zelandiae]|uniref:histone deacetylase n=1 Tax=Armillaria novae-zelandiae TaxID=153914 RepID=A0AA39TBB2_9AGAR|nr:hypothetical protein IW261DRAFT_1594481 [Armillaria novae-zelandiae]